jgi:hypothetical protein
MYFLGDLRKYEAIIPVDTSENTRKNPFAVMPHR